MLRRVQKLEPEDNVNFCRHVKHTNLKWNICMCVHSTRRVCNSGWAHSNHPPHKNICTTWSHYFITFPTHWLLTLSLIQVSTPYNPPPPTFCHNVISSIPKLIHPSWGQSCLFWNTHNLQFSFRHRNYTCISQQHKNGEMDDSLCNGKTNTGVIMYIIINWNLTHDDSLFCWQYLTVQL
jgi:hypothetical protein